MQGFILSKTSIKNQDLILRLLTPTRVLEVYRFYGMRHSIIDIGRKIDFDLQIDGHFLPKMRNILQLSYEWEKEYSRVYVWKHFISLLNLHLKDISEIEEFYFSLLEWGAHILQKQNPMRVAIEMSAKLLQYEGRNMRFGDDCCFVCQKKLDNKVALGRAFLFAHPQCIEGEVVEKSKMIDFLSTSSSICFSDLEIEQIWNVFIEGL